MSRCICTDGWRAVIGADYTFDNLTTVARATAAWVRDQHAAGIGDGAVVMGYDARFRATLRPPRRRRLASEGVRVPLGDGIATTPAVSWARDGGTRPGSSSREPQPAADNASRSAARRGRRRGDDPRLRRASRRRPTARGSAGAYATSWPTARRTFDLRGGYTALLKSGSTWTRSAARACAWRTTPCSAPARASLTDLLARRASGAAPRPQPRHVRPRAGPMEKTSRS